MMPSISGWCTLYTDASFQKREGGKSGWGVWLRHELPPSRVVRGGNCTGVHCPTAAELVAIIRGVEIAVETWPHLEGIGLKSDSKAALSIAKWKARKPKRKDLIVLQQILKSILKKHNLKLKCTWVPGHQKGNNTEAYLNNQVDTLSRKYLNQQSCYTRLVGVN